MPRNRENCLRESSGRRHRRSRTSRAELIFAVSLVEQHLREVSRARRLSDMVPVSLVAILEFLTYRLTYRFPPLVVGAVTHYTENTADNSPKPSLHVLAASLFSTRWCNSPP